MPSASPTDRKSTEPQDSAASPIPVVLHRRPFDRPFCSFDGAYETVAALDAPDGGTAIEFIEATVREQLDQQADPDQTPTRIGTLTHANGALVTLHVDDLPDVQEGSP